jgi:hypothetical protein
MQGLIQANLEHQHRQQQQMGPAEQMRQSTMTQCFNGPVAAAPAPTQPTPLPAHISCVPPSYHYYENNGNCYFFLNLASGEKVALGPVEPALAPELPASVPAPALVVRVAALEPSSFLTPTVKNRRTRAIVTSEAESSFDCGVQRCREKKKPIVTRETTSQLSLVTSQLTLRMTINRLKRLKCLQSWTVTVLTIDNCTRLATLPASPSPRPKPVSLVSLLVKLVALSMAGNSTTTRRSHNSLSTFWKLTRRQTLLMAKSKHQTKKKKVASLLPRQRLN